jgi:hypothetical protein
MVKITQDEWLRAVEVAVSKAAIPAVDEKELSRFIEIIDKSGISSMDASKIIGVSHDAIGSWRTGKTIPSRKLWAKVKANARKLGGK